MAFDANKYAVQYVREHYYVVKVRIPKDKQDTVKDIAEDRGMAVSEAFVRAFEHTYGVKISLPNA